MADENQVAGGCEGAAIVRIGKLQRRLDLSRHRVNGLEASIETFVGLLSAAREALARLHGPALVDEILLFNRLECVAAFNRGNVEQAELGIECAGLPVLATEVRRTEVRGSLAAHAVRALGIDLYVLGRIVVERQAGFRIEARRPVELVDILLAGDE